MVTKSRKKIRMTTENNGNLLEVGGTTGTALLKPTSSSTEDLSEYTDADESISAPTEFLAEFLSAVMLKDYETALKYCKLILQYEPNNATAKEFYPLILEKLRHLSYDNSDDNQSSSDSEPEDVPASPSSSSTDSSSDDDEVEDDDDEEEDVSSGAADESNHKKSRGSGEKRTTSSDGDATTASYSSLEDEEADQLTNNLPKFKIDNVDLGNGNKYICDTPGSKHWEVKKENTNTSLPFGTSSDSESPTEPVTQQIIANLRAKVVPPFRN